MKIKVKDVLDEYNIEYNYDDDKLQLLCPFHPDKTPSAYLYTDTNLFYCHGCKKSCNFYVFLKKKLGKDVFFTVNKKFSEYVDKIIQSDTIEEAHGNIKKESAKQYRQALTDRGITEHDINDNRIGLIGNRISIPIKNEAGFYVMIRLYKPGASTAKFTNFKKYGKPERLFPINQIQYDRIVLCGGELKALLAAKELNKYDIGAISTTGGEGSIPVHLLEYFRNKTVYVCLDVDKAGKVGSINYANSLCGVKGEGWVGILDLPLDVEKYPKGDINDFVVKENGKLYPLLDDCPEYEFIPPQLYEETEFPVDVSLTQAMHADYATKRIRFKAVVSTMDVSPYPIPSEVNVICDRSEKFCDLCTVSKLLPDEQKMRISGENPSLLRIIGDTSAIQEEACKEACGIPKKCRKCSFKATSFYNIEETRLSEPFKLQSTDVERSMQSAFCIGNALELNTNYEMVGRMFPHPKTQQATLMVSSYKMTEDALSNYNCNSLEKLKIFQPKEWTKEGIQIKLDDIYNDLENVTRILKRRELHLAVDLAYHSPLFIPIDGINENGWVEVLIVGDSGQGKSWVSQHLMEYYNLGEKIDCKNATKAGLIGGSENFGKRWFVTWGKFPINDRGLLLMEELKGMDPETFAKCTEMRSSGRAQIDSIVKRTTYARTRLIANSNPRSLRPVSSYNYGVDCLVELLGSREDLRRFDLCVIIDRTEVNKLDLESFRPTKPKKYTSKLCRELVLWSWTKKVDEIIFEDWEYLLKSLKRLYSIFSDAIPIVDTTTRMKVAKLSASLACRTFSIDEAGYLFVRNCHVDYIIEYLIRMYSKETFGYAQFSEAALKAENLRNPALIKHRIKEKTEYPREFIEQLLLAEDIDNFFLQDLLGTHPEDARVLLSFFIRNKAIKRENRKYRKTQEFTNLLKEMEKEIGDNHLEDSKPSFLKSEFE